MGGGASKKKDADAPAKAADAGAPAKAVPKLAPTPVPTIESMKDLPVQTLDSFELKCTLGIGSFGRVFFATYKEQNSHWALKQLKKHAVINGNQQEHVKREKNIIKMVSHPFIVNCVAAFQDPKHLYFALEFVAGGEFDTYLKGQGFLEEDHVKFYLAQLVLIFEYLHGSSTGGVVFRDLKPPNLILGIDGYLKLADFGFAKVVGTGLTYTFLGTPEYIAPEILDTKLGHTFGVDWWAMGIMAFEMLAGKPPFVGDSEMETYAMIKSSKPDNIKWTSGERPVKGPAKDMIGKLLCVEQKNRLGCKEDGSMSVKGHKFFAGLDWNALIKREVGAPHEPFVNDETDTSNFDEYGDEKEETPDPDISAGDPFVDF